jgi:hypothetical protein
LTLPLVPVTGIASWGSRLVNQKCGLESLQQHHLAKYRRLGLITEISREQQKQLLHNN